METVQLLSRLRSLTWLKIEIGSALRLRSGQANTLQIGFVWV
jgi:hypothetical protein